MVVFWSATVACLVSFRRKNYLFNVRERSLSLLKKPILILGNKQRCPHTMLTHSSAPTSSKSAFESPWRHVFPVIILTAIRGHLSANGSLNVRYLCHFNTWPTLSFCWWGQSAVARRERESENTDVEKEVREKTGGGMQSNRWLDIKTKTRGKECVFSLLFVLPWAVTLSIVLSEPSKTHPVNAVSL